MPQEQQKQQPKQQSFLQRFFGSSELSPETLQAIEIAKREMPDMAPVEPYGFLSRMFGSKNQGFVGPGGNTIYLNPAQLQGQSVQDIVDTLTHEQEHVRQAREENRGMLGRWFSQLKEGLSEPYHRRPSEMGAFQAERNRRARMGRGGTTAIPSSETGQYYVPRDIHLTGPSGRR
jgi:hypothetical protein